MTVRSWWIPKSARGRQVAWLLRANGYSIRNREVMGRFVCNLPVDLTCKLAAQIAYILRPEEAYCLERDAFEMAEFLRQEGEDEKARRLEECWALVGNHI